MGVLDVADSGWSQLLGSFEWGGPLAAVLAALVVAGVLYLSFAGVVYAARELAGGGR